MKYIIEQWNNDECFWFKVGESISQACALSICEDVKNCYPDLNFRIISVLDIF